MKDDWEWIRIVVIAILLMFWSSVAYHYGEVLSVYAANNYHITYTALYIAVECWLLLSFIMITLLLLKLVKGRQHNES